MSRRSAFVLFLVFFIAALFIQYAPFLSSRQSLFLAKFYDPSPRLCWYPRLVESARQIHEGHFPLWCNLEGAGMPLLADTGSAVLHPFNLIFEIFPYLKLLDYILLLRLVLLGIFTYLFAIEIGLSPLSAACSALTICFCGYILRNINYFLLNNDIWLPAALLAAERMVKNRVTLPLFLVFSLITALELMGGSPQSALYIFMLIFLYVLVCGRKPKQEIPFLVLALCFGFLIGSIQLTSFTEYFGYAWSSHDPGIHSVDRVPVRSLFSLFFPWIFGNANTDPQLRVSSGYIGLIPVFLTMTTVSRIRRMSSRALFFWMVLLIFAGIIFYLHPFADLNYLPVMNRIRNARSAYFGLSFSIAMLAGFGLDNFIKNRLSLRDCLMALAMTSALALLAMTLALIFPAHPSLGISNIRTWLLPAIFFMVAAAVCLAGAEIPQKKFAAFIIAALSLISLLYLARGLAPLTELQPEIGRFNNPLPPQFLTPIINDKNLSRFLGTPGVFTENLNILFKINDLRAFEALYPMGYVQAIAEIEGFKMEMAADQFIKHGWSFNIQEKNLAHPLLDQMGVKYLLTANEINAQGWVPVKRTRDHFLYINQEAWPRAWTIKNSGEYDFSIARISEYHPDRLLVDVSGEDGSGLVLSDQYAPGWKAVVLPSRAERRIFKEGLLFRKVLLKNGDRQILFFYQPAGFEIGLFASLASLVSLLLLAAAGILKRRNPATVALEKSASLN